MTKLTIDGYENILKNKYYYWYRNIIINRLINPVLTEEYTEIHHILPVSLGGGNSQENLIVLTPKEHFIVHLLLTKFIFKEGYYKMLKAFNSMNMKSKTTLYRYSNSRLYEHARKKLSAEHSKFLKENSPFKDKEVHKKCMRSRKENKSNIFVTNNPMHNQESVKKKVEKCSGKNWYAVGKSQYTNMETNECKFFSSDPGFPWRVGGKNKGKESKLKGIKQPKDICNLCGKEIAKRLMNKHIEKKHT